MGTLAISAANLNTLENNMTVLNENINSVTSDIVNINGKINNFNKDVTEVKQIVTTLEDEIHNFMKDIRENTIVANAQNDILLKENELNKKYSSLEEIRKLFKSLNGRISNSTINKMTLNSILNATLSKNPNYYLTNVIIAICYWFLNDKVKSNQYILKSLSQNESKTSLIMCNICLKLNRNNAAFRWLKKYLSCQSSDNLDNNFIILLDSFINSSFDENIQETLITEINSYVDELENIEMIKKNEIQRWRLFFRDTKETISPYDYPYIEKFCEKTDDLYEPLANSNAFYNAYYKIENILTISKPNEKNIDTILDNAIDSYEKEELLLKQSILKDRLLIENNGDSMKTNDSYKLSELSMQSGNNILEIMSNIVLNRNDVSENTKKFAFSFIKDIIKNAIDMELNSKIQLQPFNIKINDFSSKTLDGANELELKDNLKEFVAKPYEKLELEKTYFNTKTILSVTGSIIGLVVAIGVNFILGIILFLLSLAALIVFIYKLSNEKNAIELEKNTIYETYEQTLENIISEIVDINFDIKRNNDNYEYLTNYINSFNKEDYYEGKIQ